MSVNKLADNLVIQDYENVLHDKIFQLEALKHSTLVITGGTGFMATWLAGLIGYLNDSYAFHTKIYLLARNQQALKLPPLPFSRQKHVQWIEADVRNTFELPKDTNWLIHAAGTPDNRFHATHPLETMSIIAHGTYSVLRAAERCSDFRMLLNISSGSVYGPQSLSDHSISENYTGQLKCDTVSSAYAEAKRYAETLCNSSRSQARIPLIIARPFAFIGPYQSLDTPWAINNFMKDALAGNAIRILGDGKTVRSYLYASDMAFWMLKILIAGKSGETYNVGSSESTNLEQLAYLIANQFDPTPKILLRTAMSSTAQNSRFVPNVSLAEKNLGLGISVELQTAITRTIFWNKSYNA